MLDAMTVQIWIVMQDGDTLERTRTADHGLGKIFASLIEEQISEGFTEVE